MRRTLAALLASAALFAGACSDDGGQTVEALDPEAAAAALRSAPDAAADAGSARIEMVMSFDAQGEKFEITAEGMFSGAQAMLTMDLGEQLAAALPDEQLPDGFDEPMVVVVDGPITYMKMPMLAMITGSDGWLSMSAEDMGLSADLFTGGPATNNPTQMLETLRGASEEVEDLGTAEVRGTSVRGYRAVVDFEKAADQVPEEMRDAYRQMLEDTPMTKMPMDVWIDADGLPRRMEMDLAAAMAEAGGGSGTVTIDFFDYGADFDIEIPDPSEVTPFSEVAGMLGV